MDEEFFQELEQKLSAKFPAGIPRHLIGEATGYVLKPKTCRNDDCLGKGIVGRYRVGRNTVYPVAGVVQQIKEKMVEVR